MRNAVPTMVDIDHGGRPRAAGRTALAGRHAEAALPDADALPTRLPGAITVDVEDYFQVSAFEDYVSRDSWDRRSARFERRLDDILALFDAHGVTGTFFTLGWIAERYPDVVRRIVAGGHELASHGMDHRLVHTLSPAEFRADVLESKALLERTAGTSVIGYRAPSYSIDARTPWAHDILAEAGYSYSSSIAPIEHDLYGMPSAHRFAFTAAGGALLEVPITTTPILGRNIPCGGGGWFRLYPYVVSRALLRRVSRGENRSVVFYFHPWEFDHDQPRMPGLDRKTRFRHYVNLKRMAPRVERLLEDFAWGRMVDVFENELSGLVGGAELASIAR